MGRRVMQLTIAALLTTAALVGCGGDDSDSASNSTPYCVHLRAAKAAVHDLLLNHITQKRFDQLVDDLHTVRNESPEDVKAAWVTFSHAVDQFQANLRESGYTMDDMAKMSEGPMASGPAMDKAMKAAASLGTVAVSNALTKLTTQARKECGVDLGI